MQPAFFASVCVLTTFLVPLTLPGTPKDPPKAPLGAFGSPLGVLLSVKNEVILVSPPFQVLLIKFLERIPILFPTMFKGSAGLSKSIQSAGPSPMTCQVPNEYAMMPLTERFTSPPPLRQPPQGRRTTTRYNPPQPDATHMQPTYNHI